MIRALTRELCITRSGRKIAAKYSITDENVEQIIKDEVGRVFVEGLEHCGVFKRTSEGAEAFNRFINYINSL